MGKEMGERRLKMEELTTRQQEVARLMAEGMTYGEIAEQLVISRNTVRNHVHDISIRLGLVGARSGRVKWEVWRMVKADKSG